MKPDETKTPPSASDPIAAALSKRLAGLRSLPVDLGASGGFEQRLRDQLPPAPHHASRLKRPWLAPLGALAASLLLVVAIALFALNSNEARAEASQMVQFHQEALAGRVPQAMVANLSEAQKLVAAEKSGNTVAPSAAPPTEHLMACCLKPLQNQHVTCMMLEQQGTKVTLSVARTEQIKPLEGSEVTHAGHRYHVQQVRNFTMIMRDDGAVRMCLISSLSTEELLTLADQL